MNPRLPPCEVSLIKEIDWNGFKKFLNGSCCAKTVGDRLRYAEKYGFCLFNRDFSVLNSFSDSKRGHIMKALSLLSKFLGWHHDFQGLVKAYGLKWRNSTSEELIFSKIQNTQENGNVIEWIKEVKAKLPQFTEFINFMAYMFALQRNSKKLQSNRFIISQKRTWKLL